MTGYAHDELLSALRVAVNHDHLRRRRKTRAAIAVCALVLFVGGAVAAAANAPWWTVSKSDLSKATLLVKAPLGYDSHGLAAGSKIALWRAPNEGGGSCLLIGSLNAGPPTRGALCESIAGSAVYPQGQPIAVGGASSDLSHGVYDHLVLGSIDPKSAIVKVVLQRPTGTVTLAFNRGWFLGDTTPTTTLTVPNAYVVGYDASGHEVARVRVWKH
jgi:hypothetical protein